MLLNPRAYRGAADGRQSFGRVRVRETPRRDSSLGGLTIRGDGLTDLPKQVADPLRAAPVAPWRGKAAP